MLINSRLIYYHLIFNLTSFWLLNNIYGISSITYTVEGKLNESEILNIMPVTIDNKTYFRITNNWTLIPNILPLPARMDFGLSYDTDNRMIIIYGGKTSTNVLADTWIYNMDTGNWVSIPTDINGPGSRYGHTFVYLGDGKSIMLGGMDIDNTYYTDFWYFDTEKLTWFKQNISLPNPLPRVYAREALLSKNKLFYFGGYDGTNYQNDTWIFDANTGQWEKIVPSSLPTRRERAYISTQPGTEQVILYGGYTDGFYLDDTWVYTHSLRNWIQKNPVKYPSARAGGSLVFDIYNYRFLLFGGQDSRKVYEDTYIYSLTQDKWTQANPSVSPSNRTGNQAVYDDAQNKTILFLGTTNFPDVWEYTLRRTGELITPVYPAVGNTETEWLTFTMSPVTQPGNTSLQFQIASSTDSLYWSEFTGFNGRVDTFYNYTGIPVEIWKGHNNRSYLRIKAIFVTNEVPLSSTLNQLTVTFNRAPSKIKIVEPYSDQVINRSQPVFHWQNAIDNDNDELLYQLQISPTVTFTPVSINLDSLVSGVNETTVQLTTSLIEGYWYYRIRAKDGRLNSEWSDITQFRIDTMVPESISFLSSQTGPINGSIQLNWTAPGNDGTQNTLLKGKYRIKYSSFVVLNTETDWLNTETEIVLENINTYFGKKETYLVTGLLNGTSYYFAIKTVDNAGNESIISKNSQIGYTNAFPRVELVNPLLNEPLLGLYTIHWKYNDDNYGDTAIFTLYFSTNNGLSYDVIIASGLNTTEFIVDTRIVPNGMNNRILIQATDLRGLTSTDISAYALTIANINEPPKLNVHFPSGGTVLAGTINLNWSTSDVNSTDSHQYKIYLSSDNGTSWPEEITPIPISNTYYTLNTREYGNGMKYALKLEVWDSGIPSHSTFTILNDLTISNGNLPPGQFNLTNPIENSSQNVREIIFRWTAAKDPNPEDTVTYTLEYSTSSTFNFIYSIRELKKTEYKPTMLLQERTKFYWRVKAVDNLGSVTLSKPPVATFFTLTGTVISTDHNLELKSDTELPSDVRIKIVKGTTAGNDLPIIQANKTAEYDSLVRLITDEYYRIYFVNNDDNEIILSTPVWLTLSYNYLDENNDGWLDTFPGEISITNLRIGWLDERNTWLNIDHNQFFSKNSRTITARINRAGYYTVLGYSQPTELLSRVTNFPNPFNPKQENTVIRYVLTTNADITIRIYNAVGDLVTILHRLAGEEGAQGSVEGKENFVFWDGKTNRDLMVANGTYLCAVSAKTPQENKTIFRLITALK